MARGLGLVTADKPESQEICFVPGGDYRAELRSRGGWAPEPGPMLDADGTRGRRAWRRGRVHRGPAQGPGRGARRAAVRVAHRPGDERDRARDGARTSRRGDVALEKVTFVADAPPAGRGRGPCVAAVPRPGADPPPRAARGRVGPAGDRRPSRRAAGPGSWRPRRRSGRSRPGQACVLYDGDLVPRRRADRGARAARGRRAGRRGRRRRDRRVTIGPALPLALLVGLVEHGRLRADPRRRRRPAAADLHRGGPGRVGRRGDRRPARDHAAGDRRLLAGQPPR